MVESAWQRDTALSVYMPLEPRQPEVVIWPSGAVISAKSLKAMKMKEHADT